VVQPAQHFGVRADVEARKAEEGQQVVVADVEEEVVGALSRMRSRSAWTAARSISVMGIQILKKVFKKRCLCPRTADLLVGLTPGAQLLVRRWPRTAAVRCLG
jgi:hypothetical protein